METLQRTKQKNKQPAEPATPCPDCRCPTFWRSAYGGLLRCAVCEPWPSLAMVGERWTIYGVPGSTLVWVPALRRGERATTRQEASQVPQNGSDGLTWQNVDDATGSWVVVSKVRRRANGGTGGGM